MNQQNRKDDFLSDEVSYDTIAIVCFSLTRRFWTNELDFQQKKLKNSFLKFQKNFCKVFLNF